ncbi:MAG: sugar phosphate nucleotidyltransferase [Bacteroidia bacterium]
MKVIIPVAGIGTKLRPHTHTQPKALVPVAGKAILSHIVDYLITSGFNEFIFIIGYLGEKIESHVKEKYPKLKASFVLQEPREGTGHAVWTAREKVNEGEDVFIVFGDTIFEYDLKSLTVQRYSSLAVKKVEDPRSYGVVELDENGFVKNMQEKPKIPKSNLALAGVYYIKDAKLMMDCLDQLIRDKKKVNEEYNLTSGLTEMNKSGAHFKTFQIGNWFDCGNRSSLLETNAILLKRTKTDQPKKHYHENTIIIEPVSIADNCDIVDSIIGPNVSIGERTIIRKSIVRDSIIGSFSQIESAILHESVVGSDAYLKGLSQSLNIGDSTEIDFS